MNKFICRTLAAAIGLLMCQAALADDPIGRFQQVTGAVLLQRGTQTFEVKKSGETLLNGDSVITTDTGRTVWRMADDSVFAMTANSGLKIEDYVQPGADNPDGTANYLLIQGAFRTITGDIGSKQARAEMNAGHLMAAAFLQPRHPAYFRKVAASKSSAYQVKTAMANINAQRADYVTAIMPNQLALKVNSGRVEVCNSAGCADAGRGQYVRVKCPTCKPEILIDGLELPIILAELSAWDIRGSISITVPPIGNLPIEPLPPPGKGCVPVVSPTSQCVPSGPGSPVSPN